MSDLGLAFIVYNGVLEILIWWKPSLILFRIHSAVIIAAAPWTFEEFWGGFSLEVFFKLYHLHEAGFKVISLLWVIIFHLLQNRRLQSIPLNLLVTADLLQFILWTLLHWRQHFNFITKLLLLIFFFFSLFILKNGRYHLLLLFLIKIIHTCLWIARSNAIISKT